MTSEPHLREIADGVHAWIQPDGTWWINNAGAVHSGGEVVLIDTCATARRTRLSSTRSTRRTSSSAPRR
jgi:cyclase